MNCGVVLVAQRPEKIAASIREVVSELLLRRLKDRG